MRRMLITLILAAAVGIVPSAAGAKTMPRCVVPNLKGMTLSKARRQLSRAHCATGRIIGPRSGDVRAQIPRAGRRVRRGMKVALVLQAKTASQTTPTTGGPGGHTTYNATVDPTFTQNPANPLQVTYQVSADAVETVNGNTVDLAAQGNLPAGVLEFYSQGSLACTLNVGGAVDGGACGASYPAPGTYTVETVYVPNGVSAVSETEQETILPFATTTILATEIGAVSGSEFPIAVDAEPLDPSGNPVPVPAGTKLAYTVTDETTGTVVFSFSFTSDQACDITYQAISSTTAVFNGASCAPYQSSGGVPAGDSYAITATFAGSNGYTGSISQSSPV